MRTVAALDLAQLGVEADTSHRRRSNLNLHAGPADPVQRMAVDFEPGTYVRPHRHHAVAKWEMMVRLAGHAAMLSFDDYGTVVRRDNLDGTAPIIEVPAGAWHTLIALEPRTVLVEIKPGPYVPVPAGDWASWSPPEGSVSAERLVLWLERARVGDQVPVL